MMYLTNKVNNLKAYNRGLVVLMNVQEFLYSHSAIVVYYLQLNSSMEAKYLIRCFFCVIFYNISAQMHPQKGFIYENN